VEKHVEVELVVEVEREVERVVEVVHEIEVEKVVEVEKLIGMREEEVEQLKLTMQAQAEQERNALLEANEARAAEFEQKQDELKAEQERLHSQKDENTRIQEELAALEGKIMHGGEHVKDRVARQQKEIAEREKQLEQQREEDLRIAQERAKREEERLAQDGKYKSLGEEAEAKTKKLKQLWSKFRAARVEVEDLKEEFAQEKEDLLHSVRELTRQVQLQNLVIDSFVPPEEVAKLEKRAVWDDDGSEQWRLRPLSELRDEDGLERPKSHADLLRPTSLLSRQMASDLTNNDPRHRALNVLSFDLDMPERTTADYEPDVNPNVRAALTAALHDDEEVAVEAEENLPSMGGNGWTPGGGGAAATAVSAAAKLAGRAGLSLSKGSSRSGKRRPSSKNKDPDEDLEHLLSGAPAASSHANEQFPTSRGLVGAGGKRR